MPISTPPKITTPWATSGLKNSIPAAADPVNGLAGYDQGFPAINMTPKTAGGIPPFGQDFNGILFDLTEAVRYQQAGGSFPYDSVWAAAVGGYPSGALVSRTDGQGFWRNTAPNNTTDPEAGGAGWQPEGAGTTSIVMTNANVTLTPLQAARNQIRITGTLTANLQLILPTYLKQWVIINAATGSFSITVKTAAGSGSIVSQGAAAMLTGDGVNLTVVSSQQPAATEAIAGIIEIATQAETNLQTDDSRAITPLKLAGYTFKSSQISIVVSTQVTVPHTFGRVFSKFYIRLICLVAQHGWSPGEIIDNVMNITQDSSAGTSARGCYIFGQTTAQFSVGFGNLLPLIPVKTTGAVAQITAANFAVLVEAQ